MIDQQRGRRTPTGLFLMLPTLAAVPEIGEQARLTRGETLLLDGKTFAQAGKGQEFTVLKRDPGTIFVAYMKEDGSSVALGLPAELPPVEEKKDVTTALRAATVVKERKQSLTGRKKRS